MITSARRRKDAILKHKMKMAVKLGQRGASPNRLKRASRAIRKASE